MLGIIIILVISWILLKFLEKKDLHVLGLIPTKTRLTLFIIGCFGFIILNGILLYIDSKISSGIWNKNTNPDYLLMLQSFWYHVKSALYEELVFRGAFLFILVSRLGFKWGLIISALAFGIYHWFSYGIFGSSLVLMSVVLIITGAMGFAWGYAYIKTKSLLVPFGMHLGWNFSTTLLADGQPYGKLLLYVSNKQDVLNEWVNLIYHIVKGVLPAIIVIIILHLYTKQMVPIYRNLDS